MEELEEKIKTPPKKRGWSNESVAREIDVSLSKVQRREAKGANSTRLVGREFKRLFRTAGIGDE